MTRTRTWALALLCLAACVLGTIVLIISPNDDCLGSESSAYFMLPQSASQIERHSLFLSRSCTHWLKFEMKPTDLDGFVATTFIKSPLSSTFLPQKIGGIDFLQQETTWKLDTISSFLA